MDDSILNSIKELLGIKDDYKVFDKQIIIHINTVLRILNQLGVGSSTFRVTNKSDIWSDFLLEQDNLDDVKDYVYLRVRILFDPPTVSSVLEAYKEMIRELEWRLNVAVDPGETK